MIISGDSVARQGAERVAREQPCPPREAPAAPSPRFVHVLPGDEIGHRGGAGVRETGVFAPSGLGDRCCEVRSIDHVEARRMARVLEQRVNDWSVPGRSLDSEQRAWNDRIERTLTLIDSLWPGAGDTVFAALLDGEPIGLVLAIPGPAPGLHISVLLTHPGSQGAGWRLMTRAVQHSEQLGRGGCLDLYAMSEDSRNAFLAMGFEAEERGRMTLDPSLPDKPWVRDAQGLWTPRNANL